MELRPRIYAGSRIHEDFHGSDKLKEMSLRNRGNTSDDEFHFEERMDSGGIPPPPRVSGIIELGEN